MYHIQSGVDKPDINYMFNKVKSIMARGVSVGDLPSIHRTFAAQADEISNEITETYGIKNPNSAKQVASFLQNLEDAQVYEVCCIDGKWTTNKDAMAALADAGYQFAIDMLAYRKSKKYAESIKSIMDCIGTDGRIHPNVSLTKTNRISYSSPALMNIPKDLLWYAIKPNKPNNVLISADIKNQEPNILINMLQADSLKDALVAEEGLYEYMFARAFNCQATLYVFVTNGHKPGLISNTELAELGYIPPVYYTPQKPSSDQMFYKGDNIEAIDVTTVITPVGASELPVIPDSVTVLSKSGMKYKLPVVWNTYDIKKLKKEGIIEIKGDILGVDVQCKGAKRKEFKVAWNAMTYGASIFGVRNMCKNIDGDIVYKYFSAIPELKEYRSNCSKQAAELVQMTETYFKTPLHAGEYNEYKLKRVLMDLPIQGTAADVLSMLLKHTEEEIKARGLEGKLEIYYTRHDEIIFEADKDWVESVGIFQVKSIIRDIVEHQIDDWTPFKLEVEEISASEWKDIDEDDIFE